MQLKSLKNLPKNKELIVKSRRNASISQSVVNLTCARRPSQTSSMRNVVISKFSFSFNRQVIVPCSSPRLCSIRICSLSKNSFISVGVAVVARSISAGWIPIIRSRTGPPAILKFRCIICKNSHSLPELIIFALEQIGQLTQLRGEQCTKFRRIDLHSSQANCVFQVTKVE